MSPWYDGDAESKKRNFTPGTFSFNSTAGIDLDAGEEGGNIVVTGSPAKVRAHADSLTGKMLRGEV